jgi:ribosomal protein L21
MAPAPALDPNDPDYIDYTKTIKYKYNGNIESTLFGIYKLKPIDCGTISMCKGYWSASTPIDKYIYQYRSEKVKVDRNLGKEILVITNLHRDNTNEYGGRKKTYKMKRSNHRKRTQIHRRKYKNTNCSNFIRTGKMTQRLYRSK